MERALMHCANAYNLPKRLRARGRVARTNSTSNTAFRGFGAPQGMVAFEAAVEQAAAALGGVCEFFIFENFPSSFF